MTCTTTRRRIAAAALALPLSLAMTGTALATGGSTAELRTTSAAPVAAGAPDKGEAGKAAAAKAAAADKAASDKAASDKAASQKAASDKAASDNAAANKAASDKAAANEAAADKAAANEAAADKAAANKAAADRAAADKAAAEPKAAPKQTSMGSAAGAASGKSAAESTKAAPKRDSSSNPDKHGTPTEGPLSKPQPLSNADKNGTGANPGETCTHAYCSTRDGTESKNGNGGGGANGKPCAGCVGKADNKNPKGQAPDGSDRNNGYECDGNNGIGKTNPAHTGCKTPAPVPPTTPEFCPGTTIPLPAGGAKGCPKDEGKNPKGPEFCPGSTTPMPAGGAKDCPKDVKDNGAERITICHATGSATNPYVMITPSKAGVVNGHYGADHQGERDIIPAFTYKGVSYPAQGGQALLAQGCVVPTTGGTSPDIEKLCPNGQVMPGGNPANCPTAPPVCPTAPVMGPVMAGCETDVPPTEGGGTVTPPVEVDPIDGVTPDQPVEGQPIGGVTPDQGAANPVPMGPPTSVVQNGTPAVLVNVQQAAPVARASRVPSALPFTGTDAALLVTLGSLLLLAGGGILAAARERTARAA